ncbi:MAG: sulfur carrier protein ThiS [Betaproteobacteria bacterium]|nr:sulfur carrier protein ThiS [Betaproteobacteria bacterium]
MPNLLLNGEHRDFPEADTVALLVEALDFTNKRIAVGLNGEIVPKGNYAITALADGDALEIVVAVGGG